MENLMKYRQTHPRCKYCKYKRYVNNTLCGTGFFKCELKDKVLFDTLFWNIKGIFCKWYQAKEIYEL